MTAAPAPAETAPASASAAPVRVTDLNYSVAGRELLRKLDFHLTAGELLVVLGRNGAGKSTLLRHLTGELGIAQPTLSHHLKKLVDAGILTREQRGRWAHYTVVAGSLTPALAFLASADPASPPSTSTPG